MRAEHDEGLRQVEVNGQYLLHVWIHSSDHSKDGERPRLSRQKQGGYSNGEAEDGLANEPVIWQWLKPVQMHDPCVVWEQVQKKVRDHAEQQHRCCDGGKAD